MRRFKTHATPSMVVACMALFVALGGVGYAAATIGSAQIKNNAVQSKDIKNGTIVSKDIQKSTRSSLKGEKGATGATGATGARGAAGTNGTNGTNGTDGDDGDDGAPGLVRAGGRVEVVGPGVGFDPNEQFGVGSATVIKPAATTGKYCIDNLPFAPRVAVASTALAGGAGNAIAKAEIGANAAQASCPVGTEVSVQILTGANADADADFYILIN